MEGLKALRANLAVEGLVVVVWSWSDDGGGRRLIRMVGGRRWRWMSWSWPMVVADLQRRQRTREHPCASEPTMTLVPQLLVVGFDDDARQ